MGFKKVSAEDQESVLAKVAETLDDKAVEVRIPQILVTDEHLRQIGRGTGDVFADAMAIAEGLYGEVKSFADELGTGFSILDDKSVLVGKTCLFLVWRVHPGKFGSFVSAAVVTPDGGRYIVNDGSTGLGAQLKSFTQSDGKTGGYVSKKGLRSSTYATCDACGSPRDSTEDVCVSVLSNGTECGDSNTKRGTGTTYYVDLSA